MRSPAAVPALLAVLAGAAACSTGSTGAPPAPAPPPVATTPAAPAVDPCTLLSADDLADLGLEPEGLAADEAGGPLCSWQGDGLSLAVGVGSGSQNSVDAAVRRFGPGEPVTVDGRSGQRFRDAGGACVVVLDLGAQGVLTAFAAGPQGARCDEADRAVGAALPGALRTP